MRSLWYIFHMPISAPLSVKSILPVEAISQQIFLIRGLKVMLDSDLAELYQVSTKSLNQAVKRNLRRFPSDFMFELTKKEFEDLRSQFVTSSSGGRRYLPYVFTEHGVAMLASVLKSDRAVEMSILIIRAFIKLREILASNKDLAHKIEELERDQRMQNKHINSIYKIIERFLEEPIKSRGPMGFERK